MPIAFDAAGASCFGWFHPAQGMARGAGVVLCRPIGYEAMCTYQSYTLLAQALAQAGFDVLRFDYPGTGDSSGSDADPGRVAAWLESITCAVAEIKRLANVPQVSLFGVRLGATLAANAALRLGDIDSLVMWAPCLTGRSFVRELRAAGGARALPADAQDRHGMEALGYLYTDETIAGLEQTACTGLKARPAKQVLLIERDDMPGIGPLPAQYRELGAAVTCADWPGYAAMMVEPHKAVLDAQIVERITRWLSEACGPAPRTPRARSMAAIPPAASAARVVEGVHESPLRFGAGGSLFGILARPQSLRGGKQETAVLMLNVGGNYRIGPNRLYVKLARALAHAGYTSLRFDITGIGDSHPEAGFSNARLFSEQSTAETLAAIDCLAERGCRRFFLLGICSGSFIAFQTALADPRVAGQVLMNARMLEQRAGDEDATWESAMERHYKSTDFYLRSLLRPDVYRRILRGQVDVRGIAGRVATVAGARLRRVAKNWLHRGPPVEGVLSKARHLSARGTDTLIIMAEQDDGRDYVEFHFGRLGARMRGDPNFHLLVARDCDHTFSTLHSQQVVMRTVREHLDRKAAVTS